MILSNLSCSIGVGNRGALCIQSANKQVFTYIQINRRKWGDELDIYDEVGMWWIIFMECKI